MSYENSRLTFAINLDICSMNLKGSRMRTLSSERRLRGRNPPKRKGNLNYNCKNKQYPSSKATCSLNPSQKARGGNQRNQERQGTNRWAAHL